MEEGRRERRRETRAKISLPIFRRRPKKKKKKKNSTLSPSLFFKKNEKLNRPGPPTPASSARFLPTSLPTAGPPSAPRSASPQSTREEEGAARTAAASSAAEEETTTAAARPRRSRSSAASGLSRLFRSGSAGSCRSVWAAPRRPPWWSPRRRRRRRRRRLRRLPGAPRPFCGARRAGSQSGCGGSPGKLLRRLLLFPPLPLRSLFGRGSQRSSERGPGPQSLPAPGSRGRFGARPEKHTSSGGGSSPAPPPPRSWRPRSGRRNQPAPRGGGAKKCTTSFPPRRTGSGRGRGPWRGSRGGGRSWAGCRSSRR